MEATDLPTRRDLAERLIRELASGTAEEGIFSLSGRKGRFEEALNDLWVIAQEDAVRIAQEDVVRIAQEDVVRSAQEETRAEAQDAQEEQAVVRPWRPVEELSYQQRHKGARVELRDPEDNRQAYWNDGMPGMEWCAEVMGEQESALSHRVHGHSLRYFGAKNPDDAFYYSKVMPDGTLWRRLTDKEDE